MNKWEQDARVIGAASDPALGLNPISGTPLGTTEIVTQQGQGIHEYRRGKIAEFWAEIYRDWGLPHFSKEINKGSKWLDKLSLEELEFIAEKVSTKEKNRKVKSMILEGETFTKERVEQFREMVKEQFMNGGEERFLEAIKDEFKDLELDVDVNVSGKQENMAEMISKLNSVFRSLFTPGAIQALQASPELSKLLNQILESAGMNQISFGSPQRQIQAPPQQTQPPQELVANNV